MSEGSSVPEIPSEFSIGIQLTNDQCRAIIQSLLQISENRVLQRGAIKKCCFPVPSEQGRNKVSMEKGSCQYV